MGPDGPQQRVGIKQDTAILDVTQAYRFHLKQRDEPAADALVNATTPPTMRAFLEAGDRAIEAAKTAAQYTDTDQRQESVPFRYPASEITQLAAVPSPNSIRAFSVFEEHLENAFPTDIDPVWYELPIFWKGNPHSIVHPGETIPWPTYTEKLDFELEIAAVIGREGENIDAANAEEYVAGYTLHNDWSARDIQMREMKMGLGPSKGKDFANGFGPILRTPNEFEPTALEYEIRVNGDVWTADTLSEYQYSFPELIEHVSTGERLYPGDIIVSGTVPRGCGLELDRWIQPGDRVELEVEGLGTLENHVGQQPEYQPL